MKYPKPLIFLIFSLMFFGCSSTKGNQESSQIGVKTNGEATTVVKPEQLTYESFLKKVWNFEKHPQKWVYEGKEPCVIDFYADWCGPCKRVAPIMEEIAQKYNGKIKVYKINVDQEKKLAAVFRIQSIPQVLFSPVKGKPMMQVGLLPHDTYVKIINEQLLNLKPKKIISK